MPKEYEYNVPLSKILLQSDGKSINTTNIGIILEEDVPVFCKNKKAQKYRLMPFKTLYSANNNFWRQDTGWDFFLTRETLDKLKEKNIIEPDDSEPEDAKKIESAPQKPAVVPGFGDDYKVIEVMSTAEKIKCLNDIKHKMEDLVSKKTRDKSTVTNVMVNGTRDAVMINHSAIKDVSNLLDSEAKKKTQTLVYTTHEMVRSYTELISQNIFDDELMKRLVEKSNGMIVQHMTRVYLNGVAFLAYYNKFVSNRAAIINMRKTLNAKYRQYYQNLLPYISIDDIVLERVFQKGMIPVPSDLFVKWAVGFLIHDIGKADTVDYHESEASFEPSIVYEHVKLGYNSVVSKTNYPKEASLITGYHHEYYGNPQGYGYFRDHLEHYQKANPQVKPGYCITFDLDSILDCNALAYFPAKILEIVDVYDSVTDPNRVYHKALNSEEALVMMRDEFIIKSPKIDPILFELFTSFLQGRKSKAK
ncbi:MAG: metal-dependent phosphohydrolase [Treponema sp.]|jgi:hypothetical protein|nr:metal-dependent phosphohydrolase [Treponema sp.]